ncbi:MAG: hypothetical protein KC776_42320 [Myxococcales bacterium]|nr:hypothetical protein [Myxococcales bacterium]
MSISPIMNTNSPSVLEGSNPNALTAEGLMLYLETRMNGLDEQINAAFDKQKKIEGIRKELMKIQNALGGLSEEKGLHGTHNDHGGWMGWKDGGASAASTKKDGMAGYEKEITDALAEIDQIDPELGKAVRKSMSTDGAGSLYYLNGQYKGEEVKAAKECVNNFMKQLESSAQLEMIGLQSKMSARQTAIQLATNLISALNKGTDAIAANVGR